MAEVYEDFYIGVGVGVALTGCEGQFDRLSGTDDFVHSGFNFPTGGFANPTLKIVALALRLSDHLKMV